MATPLLTCPIFNTTTQWDSYFILNGVVFPIVMTFGLFGNISVVLVFCRTRFWKSLRIYIVTLSIWDQLVIVSAFWLFTLNCWQRYGILNAGHWLLHSYAFSYTIANASFTGHIYAIIALTIERYLAIVHPLKHRTLQPNRLCLWLECIAIVSSISLSLPRFFEVMVVDCYDVELMRARTAVSKSSLLDIEQNPSYVRIFRSAIVPICTNIAPFLILTILTIHMIVVVQRSQEQLTALPPKRMGEQTRTFLQRMGTTIMRMDSRSNRSLLVVFVKTIICFTMPAMNDIFEYVVQAPTLMRALNDYLVDVGDLLVILDASIAFYIYCITSSNFRAHFLGLISGATMDKSQQLKLSGHALASLYQHSFMLANSRRCPRSETTGSGGTLQQRYVNGKSIYEKNRHRTSQKSTHSVSTLTNDWFLTTQGVTLAPRTTVKI